MNLLLRTAGPASITITFILMYHHVEPFSTFFYLFAWYGLIFTFDRAIAHREGRSLIVRCGPRFVHLLFWSAVTWFLFEVINLRLENWYYIFVPDSAWLRYTNTLLAFCTVFPGMFWIDHYLGLRGVFSNIRGNTRTCSPRTRGIMVLAGVACFALPLIWPTWFFPLVWLSLIFLIAPLQYNRDPDSILHQCERGNYGPTLRMLLAGLIAGLFWEFFNFWARAKWVYTVPFFDELKLFEMPVAGFLGFPPFAVECAIIYKLLVWHRLAPEFGQFKGRREGAARPALATLVVIVSIIFVAVTHHYMDQKTTASVTPRAAKLEGIDDTTHRALADLDIEYLTQLEGIRGEPLWRELSSHLDPARYDELKRRTGLILHMGIGIEQGNRLLEAGIRSVEALAQLSPEELHNRLGRSDDPRAPTLPRVKVWIRRAHSDAVTGAP